MSNIFLISCIQMRISSSTRVSLSGQLLLFYLNWQNLSQAPSHLQSRYQSSDYNSPNFLAAFCSFFLSRQLKHLRRRQNSMSRIAATIKKIAIVVPKFICLFTYYNHYDQQTYQTFVKSLFNQVPFLVTPSHFGLLQLQLMEINKPDKGIFKGIGILETETHQNRKPFPRIRNTHQFEYTHHHRNDYVSSFQRFFSTNKTNPVMEKVKKHSNQSHLQLGTDPNNYINSLSRTDYKHFEKAVPPKPFVPKQQGVSLGNEPKEHHFVTTTMDRFTKQEENPKNKVTFKNRGLGRFNPITGETRTLSFGFQDFEMGRKNNYKANNFSVVPQKHENVDIITGRRLTFQ